MHAGKLASHKIMAQPRLWGNRAAGIWDRGCDYSNYSHNGGEQFDTDSVKKCWIRTKTTLLIEHMYVLAKLDDHERMIFTSSLMASSRSVPFLEFELDMNSSAWLDPDTNIPVLLDAPWQEL